MTGIPKVNTFSEKLAEKFLNCRSENEMTILLANLLHLTFTAILKKDKGRYYLNRPFGSYEPQDLDLSLDSISSQNNEFDHPAVWESLLEMTSNIKFLEEVNGKLRELKIIPVIALDEAGCFIDSVFDFNGMKKAMNSFRLIRRSLRAKGKFFWTCPFIFAGTNTRFGNFVPSASNDPSARLDLPSGSDATPTALRLFEPYILTSTWDVYARDRNYSGEVISDWLAYITSNDYLYHLSNYGRPVWGAFVQACIRKGKSMLPSSRPFSFPHLPEGVKMVYAWKQLRGLASQKIAYPLTNCTEEDQIQSAVAIISLTTDIGFYHSSLVTSLIERRMAFLLDYRYDRGQLLVTYPVEPLLSIEALVNLQGSAEQIIRSLLSARAFSSDNMGETGELVSRMLFLLCIPKFDGSRPYAPVKEFMRNIVGDVTLSSLYKTKNKDALEILDGYLCMSSFLKISDMSLDPLKNIGLGVMFNVGLSMPNGSYGLDEVIPVVLKDGRLGSINVQCKSRAEKLSNGQVSEAVGKLSNICVCSDSIPRLNMLVNLTPCRDTKIMEIIEDGGKVVIHIEGLFSEAFPHIDEKYRGLKELLLILLEFGRLERTLNGEKSARAPKSRNIDLVYKSLEKNSFECPVSSSDSPKTKGRKRLKRGGPHAV
jgi:hypothetical protein